MPALPKHHVGGNPTTLLAVELLLVVNHILLHVPQNIRIKKAFPSTRTFANPGVKNNGEQKEEEGSREEVGRVAEDPRVHFLEEGEVVRRKHVDFFDEQSPLPAVQDDFEHPVDAQQARGTLHESLVFGQPDANAF